MRTKQKTGVLCLALAACAPALEPGDMDFESGSLEGWILVEGDLGRQPTASIRQDFHAHGLYFLGTGETGTGGYSDPLRGTLRSPGFVLERDFILFRIGGCQASACSFSLVRDSDGMVLRRATGAGDERMRTLLWDVADLRGESTYLELVDHFTGEWGHLNVDYIRFRDE